MINIFLSIKKKSKIFGDCRMKFLVDDQRYTLDLISHHPIKDL